MSAAPGPRLAAARALAAAVTLQDGKVLLAGGVDDLGNVLASAEIYDPVARTFTPTGAMGVPRVLHAAARLPDGKVLVSGGTTTLMDPVQLLATAQSSAEVFDPATGTWSGAAAMSRRLIGHGLHALGTGRVLASGGFQVNVLFGIPLPVGSIRECQLYNPATNAWTSAASMIQTRAVHGPSSIVLPNGRVLVTGGAQSGPDLTMAVTTAQAEVYDPVANAWANLPNMAVARITQSVTVIPDAGGGPGVLVAGGATGSFAAPAAVDTVELLELSTLQWRPLPNLVAARGGHGAVLTPDGMAVLFGGQGAGGSTLASIETVRF
jgi:hypothetical protein